MALHDDFRVINAIQSVHQILYDLTFQYSKGCLIGVDRIIDTHFSDPWSSQLFERAGEHSEGGDIPLMSFFTIWRARSRLPSLRCFYSRKWIWHYPLPVISFDVHLRASGTSQAFQALHIQDSWHEPSELSIKECHPRHSYARDFFLIIEVHGWRNFACSTFHFLCYFRHLFYWDCKISLCINPSVRSAFPSFSFYDSQLLS